MRADRSGTPSEQSRANAGWITPGAANRARQTGGVRSDQSCAMCHYIMSAGTGWRCVHPDSTPVTGWATGLKSWCPRWTAAVSLSPRTQEPT